MGKRYNFYFGDALSEEMEHLASVMQDGNVKATIAELVHAEMRRRFGDKYAHNASQKPAKASENDPKPVVKEEPPFDLDESSSDHHRVVAPEGAVEVVNNVPAKGSAATDMDKFAEMRAAAAAKLAAKKASPKPITGIVSQA